MTLPGIANDFRRIDFKNLVAKDIFPNSSQLLDLGLAQTQFDVSILCPYSYRIPREGDQISTDCDDMFPLLVRKYIRGKQIARTEARQARHVATNKCPAPLASPKHLPNWTSICSKAGHGLF